MLRNRKIFIGGPFTPLQEAIARVMAREGARLCLGDPRLGPEDLLVKQIADLGHYPLLLQGTGGSGDCLGEAAGRYGWFDAIVTAGNGFWPSPVELAPLLPAGGGGAVINLMQFDGDGSTESLRRWGAALEHCRSATRLAALEEATRGWTCNTVVAGWLRGSETAEDGLIPLGGRGEPEQVAELVAFLASSRAVYITGQLIAVDGGLSI